MNEILKRLDTTESTKIAALTLLAENASAKEFLSLLEGRLKTAEREKKLPYWCLLDSLLNHGSEELKIGVVRMLPRHVGSQIPWGVVSQRAMYMKMVESWVDRKLDLSGNIAKAVKDGLIIERENVKNQARVMSQGALRSQLRLAAQAVAEIQVGQEEQLLTPAETDFVEEPRNESMKGDEEEQEEDEEKNTDTRASTPTPANPIQTTEKAPFCPPEKEIPTDFDSVIKTTVSSLYAHPFQCSKTGRRFREEIDTTTRDIVYKIRSTDTKLQKCRSWFPDCTKWADITETRYGLAAVSLRSQLGKEPAISTLKRKASSKEEEVFVSDPTEVRRCAVCGDIFEKKPVSSSWLVVDCIKVGTQGGVFYVHPECEDDIPSKK